MSAPRLFAMAGVLALLAGAAWLWNGWPRSQPSTTTVPCADIVAGCTLPEARLQVRLDRVPVPMQPFHLEVALPEAKAVSARFGMQGMEMGLNRYRLLPDGAGRWSAQVLLPACVVGRRNWELLLEAGDRRYALVFVSG